MVLDWLAAGIDPARAVIFVQSQVIEHSELHLLLSMITPLSWLERCPTYKEQLEQVKDKDLHTYGFLGYPVLQTADIVMYLANWVPVGVDQLPHLELAREIVRRFHFLYGEGVLVEPQPKLTEFPKIPGTDGRKMSKSYGNSIFLSDSAEETGRKILGVPKERPGMVTDPARVRRTDPGDPEKCPVFTLHRVAWGVNIGQAATNRLGLVFAVENLTDVFYREQFQFAPSRGRSFTIGLHLRGH